jgi:hypothetical protein
MRQCPESRNRKTINRFFIFGSLRLIKVIL